MGGGSLSRDTTSCSRGHHPLEQGTPHVHRQGIVSIEASSLNRKGFEGLVRPYDKHEKIRPRKSYKSDAVVESSGSEGGTNGSEKKKSFKCTVVSGFKANINLPDSVDVLMCWFEVMKI